MPKGERRTLFSQPRGIAMLRLGEEWWGALKAHPPEKWFPSDFEAYKAFAMDLYERTVTERSEVYERFGPGEAQREVYRKTLPPFEVFQPWYAYQVARVDSEWVAGIRASARAQETEDLKKTYESDTGLAVENPEGLHYSTGEAKKWIEGAK